MSQSTIKNDLSHSQEEWARSRQNSTQIAFFGIIEIFDSKPNSSFLLLHISNSTSVFNPDFCMSQKCPRQTYLIWNKSQIFTNQLRTFFQYVFPIPHQLKIQYYEFHRVFLYLHQGSCQRIKRYSKMH